MTALYDEMRKLVERGEPAAVATIIRTKGSTPREVGARMVITRAGQTIGTIGGGCGEAEVWGEAMETIETGTPRIVEVDLLHDHDAEGGRACGGIMFVFVEPLLTIVDGQRRTMPQSVSSPDGNE
jgi:xanthine/CO dehydrogenase XdhC/CoxF family maturation factor